MKSLVTKHNALIKASYRLTLSEIRLILYGVSLINPVKNECPLAYIIDVGSYAEMFNLDKNHLYQEIKDTARKNLFRREFSYDIGDGKTRITSWLSAIDYQNESGYLKLYFTETIKPLLHQIKKIFTTYYIEQISKFSSVYSVRIYEQSLMFLKKSKKDLVIYKIKISKLKSMLGISDKYKHFPNFRKYVLEKSKSDLTIKFDVMKSGRSPHEIKFTVTRKKEPRQMLKVSLAAIEKAQQINVQHGSMLDIYVVEQQFYEYSKTKGLPKNTDSAFIGFVKKKLKP